MKNLRSQTELAAKEHLVSGAPITRLEALALFGLSDLTRLISRMRKDGWVIESRRVPFATATKRINQFAIFQPPKNLPTREINLTEYWVNK